MTDSLDARSETATATPGPRTAGGRLKAAREEAGLSIDAVAQQLKLAPRQVKALEDDDYQRLPGRTFVRGFSRNYARLVKLDPDAVLASLPPAESAPALERPTFAPARRPMGEIPVERVTRPSIARWMIPGLLLAVIAAAAYHEFTRPKPDALHNVRPGSAAPNAGAPAPAASAESGLAAGAVTTALPNPLAAPNPSGGETRGAAGGNIAAAPPAFGAISVNPGPGAASEPLLVLTFQGASWVEVKDADGRVLLSQMGTPGSAQSVSGTPPIQLSLGNAPEVRVTFRGQLLDLAPYTRANVARVSLK